MTLVYRAVVAPGSPSELHGGVREEFAAWLKNQALTLDLPLSGTVESGNAELTVAEASDSEVSALRIVLSEEQAAGRLVTTVTAASAGSVSWIWVDVERLANDPYARLPEVGVPGIAPALLNRWVSKSGSTTLATGPTPVDALGVGDLLHQLTDPERLAPLIVMSRDRYASPEMAMDRADLIQDRVVGLANVFVLNADATTALADVLGPELQVTGGAVRTYMGGLTIPDRNPKRHGQIAGSLVAGQTAAAANRIQRQVTQHAVSQRPPQLYRERIASLPGFPRHLNKGQDDELIVELIALEAERDQLVGQVAGLRDEVEYSALQLDETEAELDSAQARVRYLESRLRAAGDRSAHLPTPATAVPESADSCADAIGQARQYLDNLDIGDTDFFAGQLDTHVKSSSWGKKAWRAFRAMQDYADLKTTVGFDGDFLAYCEQSPSALTMIPEGWVALRESESTDNNPKYRGARTFPVPEEVHEDESVYMCAHIKLEAGGRPAPRIHFFDDTAGTGFIYVGYFGEHLPNDQTN